MYAEVRYWQHTATNTPINTYTYSLYGSGSCKIVVYWKVNQKGTFLKKVP